MSNELIPSQTIHTSSPSTPTISSHLQTAIGHSLHHKSPQSTRIILQNPNGFSRENDLFSFQLALENLKSASADILLFPETNLHWSNYDILKAANRHRRNTFQFSKQINSHSQLHYDTPYQPGGTTSIITDNLLGRYHSSSSDMTFGRWSVTHLNLPRNQTLTIICCYQVCDQTISQVGPRTAYSQQWSLLRQQGQHNPHPRKQFYLDLDRMLTRFHQQGHQLILAGDFNSTLGEDPTGLDRLLHKFHLVDPVLHMDHTLVPLILVVPSVSTTS